MIREVRAQFEWEPGKKLSNSNSNEYLEINLWWNLNSSKNLETKLQNQIRIKILNRDLEFEFA